MRSCSGPKKDHAACHFCHFILCSFRMLKDRKFFIYNVQNDFFHSLQWEKRSPTAASTTSSQINLNLGLGVETRPQTGTQTQIPLELNSIWTELISSVPKSFLQGGSGKLAYIFGLAVGLKRCINTDYWLCWWLACVHLCRMCRFIRAPNFIIWQIPPVHSGRVKQQPMITELVGYNYLIHQMSNTNKSQKAQTWI